MLHKDRKAALRRERLASRDAMSVESRIEASLAIADAGAAAIEVLPGTIVSGFFPIRSEVDIRPLLAKLRERGARLALPIIHDRETIVFRELLPGAELVDTGFGTRGPGPEAPVVDPGLMLVPLAAFDARGHRIGYGAGYYDRAIARLRASGKEPRLIGIAFDCQEVPEVPAEDHDVELEALLTESGFRVFGKQVSA
ncbi:5-formyltetrahydrofolate cyclo-ligase [Ciceribacter sp. L1K23]|uniref:5-formyltetrahydrofolate cyclo-ligase n=1 Tax=Ciceribacter sp. L1K23 TaxID=2820276 RepID=UPI001B819986|nr:5-formyltetrahydrofolate cyclo-ligase [Ciceribacter sp. L1K23]MBR0558192.1 5-formyltetrahydrofolate cyclo-ligase [Ciceribacter sp. L1K23]